MSAHSSHELVCRGFCWHDNLKSAVLERHGDAIRFHPTLLAFAGHYHYERGPHRRVTRPVRRPDGGIKQTASRKRRSRLR